MKKVKITVLKTKFNEDLAKWIEEATVEWRVPEMENIDFNALFGIIPETKPASKGRNPDPETGYQSVDIE